MNLKRIGIVFFCMLSAFGGAFGGAFAGDLRVLRHGGEIVQVGDSQLDILLRLGRPSGKISNDYTIIHGDIEHGDRDYVTQEYWFYNFGSRQFTYTLIFENSFLTHIEQGFYGNDNPDTYVCNAESKLVNNLEIMPQVLMKCGEPDFVEVTRMDRIEKLEKGLHRQYHVRIEDWTYNFGPDQFTSILRFENGVLKEIFQGDRGWEPR